MKKLFLSLAIILVLSTFQGLSAQQKYTNQTVDLREGPGAFYDMLMRLFLNNQVMVDSTQGYWELIKVHSKTGWVPAYTLSDQPLNEDKMKADSLKDRMSLMFSQLGGARGTSDASALSASPAQVAAAVKGFADKYRESKNLSYTVDLDRFTIDPFTVSEYLRFRNERAISLTNRKRRSLLFPSATFLPYPDPAIDQIGYAVATAVAQEGLVQNYEAQKYLDLMIALITEFSHRPDLETHAYILDTDDILGYSLPGNFIFISKGAIKAMNNESELAHFIGHEIAHLTFGHGMLEYQERSGKIRAADAFDELDSQFEDLGAETQELENELNAWADQMFDYIHKDRLEAYETSADYWGIVYTYLSGLDPFQSIKYLNRIEINSEEARMEWNGLNLEQRKEYLQGVFRDLNIRSGKKDSDMFQRIKRSLD